MKPNYRAFFALTREPFGSNLAPKGIMQTTEVLGVAKRFEYAIRLGALVLVTGDVGSGKSTALRWAASRLHPSEYQIIWVIAAYQVIWVTASQGSILELYRQICVELEVDTASFSRAVFTNLVRKQVLKIVQYRKKRFPPIIEEASLLRLQVRAELYTITQVQGDFKPIILVGQNNLVASSYTEPPCP
ncbi:hypothetical protein DFAR_4000002 [Desulfarculales bacterium]